MTEQRDLANELIRETYKNKSTLIVAAQHSLPSLRRLIANAKRFMADDSMSEFMGTLAMVPFKVASERWADILASLRHTARLPFPSLFLQYDGHAFRRGLTAVRDSKDAWGLPLSRVDAEEVVSKVGWLFTVDTNDDDLIWMQVFVHVDTLAPYALPFRYAYRTDDRGFDPCLNIDTRPNQLMTGLLGTNDVNVGVQYCMPLVKFPQSQRVRVEGTRHESKLLRYEPFEMHMMIGEFGGDLRYALCLLATLNDIPKVESVVRPAKSYVGGGQIRKYLDYTTLRLTLPVRVSTQTLAKRLIAKARRGWHEVRPHWRVNHPRLNGVYCSARAEHVWLEADEKGHANCKLCDARRVWIVLPTGRGDPTISIRTHRYALTHPTS